MIAPGAHCRLVWRREDEDHYDLWVKVIGEENPLQLTTDPADELSPVWSPDGEFVYFESSRGDSPGVWRRRADLSAPAELVLELEWGELTDQISSTVTDVKALLWGDVDQSRDILEVGLGEWSPQDEYHDLLVK